LEVLPIGGTNYWRYYLFEVLPIGGTIYWKYYLLEVLSIGSTTHLRYYSGNCLEDFCKEGEIPARNLNPGPPECEAELLPPLPPGSVNLWRFVSRNHDRVSIGNNK
jgi:hypothetical protein